MLSVARYNPDYFSAQLFKYLKRHSSLILKKKSFFVAFFLYHHHVYKQQYTISFTQLNDMNSHVVTFE